MKTRELPTIWGAPEPSRLTPKQLSIRLPMLVSAKIQALCDLFPRKAKTEIIGDLLASALEVLEHELPMRIDHSHEVYSYPEVEGVYYGYMGMRKDYFKKVKKYLKEIEKEANVEPVEFSYDDVFPEAEFKWE